MARSYIVDFWISDATPRWRVIASGETFGGVGDSRQDAIKGATAKLTELERRPMTEDDAAGFTSTGPSE